VYDAPFVGLAQIAPDLADRTLIATGVSKTYAMTGWRIGYLLGPPDVVRAVEIIQSHATSNPTSFAMVGALEALRHCDAEAEAMIAEYAARRQMLIPRLNEIPGFRCKPPDGAFYAFPHVAALYRPGLQGSVELSELLLEKARVAVVPGEAFGADDHIRISFACSRAALAEGLERIAAVLAD
jgi:aspartate aminotransferase